MSTATTSSSRFTDPSRLAGRAGFFGGIVFAGVAALALPAVALATGHWLGTSVGLAVALIITATAFVGFCAPSLRTSARGVGIMTLGGVALLAGAPWLGHGVVGVTAIGCAALISLVRSGLYYRMPGRRGLVAELLLQGGGLGLAALLDGPGPLGQASAVWGYLLVQSVFGLIPGLRRRSITQLQVDPFDHSMRQLEGVLDA